MRTLVERYAVAWSPGNDKGVFYIYLPCNTKPTQLDPSSSEEFIAILLMLSKNNLMWDSDQKQFELDTRPAGT